MPTSDIQLNRIYLYIFFYGFLIVLDRLDYGARLITDKFINIMKSPGTYAHYLLEDSVNEATVRGLVYTVYKHLAFVISMVGAVTTLFLSLFSLDGISTLDTQRPIQYAGLLLLLVIIMYLFLFSEVKGHYFEGNTHKDIEYIREFIAFRNISAPAKGRILAHFMVNLSTVIIVIVAYLTVSPFYKSYLEIKKQETQKAIENSSHSFHTSSPLLPHNP